MIVAPKRCRFGLKWFTNLSNLSIYNLALFVKSIHSIVSVSCPWQIAIDCGTEFPLISSPFRQFDYIVFAVKKIKENHEISWSFWEEYFFGHKKGMPYLEDIFGIIKTFEFGHSMSMTFDPYARRKRNGGQIVSVAFK